MDGKKSGPYQTKWCVTNFSGAYIEFESKVSITPVGYVLTTGNDTGSNSGRNPKDWVIKGRNDSNEAWTILTTVTLEYLTVRRPSVH